MSAVKMSLWRRRRNPVKCAKGQSVVVERDFSSVFQRIGYDADVFLGISEHQNRLGLRVVALFEAVKGILVLCLVFGLLALRNTDIQAFAVDKVAKLHINPEAHYPHLFIDHLGKLGDTQISQFAMLALLYSLLRFVEAGGLWFEKHWAEWVAVLSASLYLPYEVALIIKNPGWFELLVFGINLLIVAYLSHVLVTQRRERLARKVLAQSACQAKPGADHAETADHR